jgi:hypothetical protein
MFFFRDRDKIFDCIVPIIFYSPFEIIINKPFSFPRILRLLIILRLSPYLEFVGTLIPAEFTPSPTITKPTLKLCPESETKLKTYSNGRLLKCSEIFKT